VGNVVFSEGLVQFRGRWFLFFGGGGFDCAGAALRKMVIINTWCV
jgi:hypothetical protein